MRVSMRWLQELVEVDMPVSGLADLLDMTGTAVEAVHRLGEGLEGVVVGRVLRKEPHPDAEKLTVCEVDVGGERPLRIVCGAANFREGDKVPVATVGAALPGGARIERARLRGVESEGMMCSAPELGVTGDPSGLLVLPSDAPVGASFAEYYGLADVVLELEVTPNRPDELSMKGIAREVGAITRKPWRSPSFELTEVGPGVDTLVHVSIEDEDLCGRYAARFVRGVKVGPSPAWLQERLAAAGARPVNNIVDVTNYVMFEAGQPLHAFDAATIAEADGRSAIVVRRARPGEKLVTLDGQERDLTEDMLVIADPERAVALAGVMGGADTEVSEETVDVLLESAYFAPTSVSRTSRKLGLVSEASLRFERGVDPHGCERASARAAQLMAEVAGGEVAPGVVDAYPHPVIPARLTLRVARVNAILGTSLQREDVTDILRRLGLETAGDGEELEVTVPTFRPDLEREVDLVEEVVRVWGMDRVPLTLPCGSERVGALTEQQRLRRRVGAALRAAGLNETITYSFVDPEDVARLGWTFGPDERPVELVNPMSAEQSVMRPTLAAGLLRAVSYNQARGVPDVHLYETGKVFWTAEGRKRPKEREMAGGAMAGAWHRPEWSEEARTLEFFDGKGVLASLAEELGVERWRVRAAERPWLQAGRAAEVLLDGDVAGWLGEVDPLVAEAFETQPPVVMFELSMPSLTRAAVVLKPYADIPRFPAVNLDVALVVAEDVTAERVQEAIRSAGGKLLESVRLFDVYRGKGVPEGAKSLAFALAYRAEDRTLTDEEVRAVHDKLVRKVAGAVGAELRA